MVKKMILSAIVLLSLGCQIQNIKAAGVAYSPDGRYLAVSGDNGKYEVIRTSDDAVISRGQMK